ncbi:MAG: 23S rRNA (adenine(2503)-C(2))-methyltransferase RlmN [Lachnospiraceae bacterium]|nr:23S rRNA (adenine(2503)-C(2))-methyltransferase RlmN [Lachnospiraceae bacterium]
MIDIKSMPYEQLKEYCISLGQKGFRADQLYDWMHVKLAESFDSMTNLPAAFRESLSQLCDYTCLTMEKRQISAIDGTQKYLFSLQDGQMIESVLMPYHHGNSVCISSQAGCRMGCRFCASTIGGLVRNLTPGEMLDQIYAITRITGQRVSNVVVMGTGEPLDNYENLLIFIKMLTDEHGLHISQRNLTVSTCGLAEKILALAEHRFQITLALSLHAATDEKRKQIMPVANKYSIDTLMDAVSEYHEKTGRRITFEYSLIAGVNDTDEDARLLTALAKKTGAHVNLIPVNPVTETGFLPPNKQEADVFKLKLEKNHINVTIRRSMGRDIDGACGQLRRKETANPARRSI